MSSTLFGLLGISGSAPLDELRARSPIDPSQLPRTLATMLQEGTIAMSLTFDTLPANGPSSADPDFRRVFDLIRDQKDGELQELAKKDSDGFVRAMQSALSDDDAAASILITPTSKGFRRAIA